MVDSLARAQARLTVDDLVPDVQAQLTTQAYGAKPRILGVELVELTAFAESGGLFLETARLDEQGRLAAFAHLDFRVRQCNFSEMEPGAIKAWHLHFNQEDVWFVPPRDRLLVGLWDVRRDSPTAGQTMRLVLGAGRARLLYIPRGVAHGAVNLSDRPVQIWYFVNQQFDAADPDERRLPWDAQGAEFWEMERG